MRIYVANTNVEPIFAFDLNARIKLQLNADPVAGSMKHHDYI